MTTQTVQRQMFGQAPAAFDSKRNAAAATIATTVLSRVESELLAAGARGATDEELSDAMRSHGLAHKESTIRARRVELVAARKVLDSGRRRATRAGVDAVVWVWAARPDAISIDSDHRVAGGDRRDEREAVAAMKMFTSPSAPGVAIDRVEVLPAALPCSVCGSRKWRYPTAEVSEPRAVVCHGCGRFIGYARPLPIPPDSLS